MGGSETSTNTTHASTGFLEAGATIHSALPLDVAKTLRHGVAIPAHPLALTRLRKLDERRQRALARYYIAAGAGGIAVGVHTTQFEIRNPEIGLFRPVLELAAEEMTRADEARKTPLVRIAGICGQTKQAIDEATLARELGYHAGLLSLKAICNAGEDALVEHCRQVAEVLPIVGFYLQEAVGGRHLSYGFWRKLCEGVHGVVAIKMAPFNRYRTLDVVRAVADAERDDIALYTGNDDHIVMDLLTPYRLIVNGQAVTRRIVGGLLGHWAVWTKPAARILEACHRAIVAGRGADEEMLALAEQVTDANAAVFDAANGFEGVIAGVNEVLRRQGLLEGAWCLDENEQLGPGQREELDRVSTSYPHLIDDAFIAEHRDSWLRG